VHEIPDNVTIPGLKTPKISFSGLTIPAVSLPKVDLKVSSGQPGTAQHKPVQSGWPSPVQSSPARPGPARPGPAQSRLPCCSRPCSCQTVAGPRCPRPCTTRASPAPAARRPSPPALQVANSSGKGLRPAKVSIGLPFPAKPHGKGAAGNAKINFTLPNPLLPKVTLKITQGPLPTVYDVPKAPVVEFAQGKGASLSSLLPPSQGKGAAVEPILDLMIPNVVINPGKGVLTVGTNGPTTLTLRGPFGGANGNTAAAGAAPKAAAPKAAAPKAAPKAAAPAL
jgi:hypothetical protein